MPKLNRSAQIKQINRQADEDPQTLRISIDAKTPVVSQDLYLFFVKSKITADYLVDLLEHWWSEVKDQFSQICRGVLNADNGPENHSRRPQLMKRLVDWVYRDTVYETGVRLAKKEMERLEKQFY